MKDALCFACVLIGKDKNVSFLGVDSHPSNNLSKDNCYSGLNSVSPKLHVRPELQMEPYLEIEPWQM